MLLAGEVNRDRGPARGLLVRDVRIHKVQATGLYEGEIFLFDTKTEGRDRTIPITHSLCRELLVLCHDKRPDDPVFNLSYQELDFPWQQVREEAGLSSVRFKDLRAQFSILAERAGLTLSQVASAMGHHGSDTAMTRRYQKHHAAMDLAHAEAIERELLAAAGEKAGVKTNTNTRTDREAKSPSTLSSKGADFGSPGRTRTYNPAVNSRMLYH